MNQEELDPKEVQQETHEQMEAPPTEVQEEEQEVTVAEEAEETDDQVRTVEAEDDHEEPKEQVPDFDALDLEQSLEAIKQHVGSYPPHRIKGIVESGRSRMLRELNAQQAEAKENTSLRAGTS